MTSNQTPAQKTAFLVLCFLMTAQAGTGFSALAPTAPSEKVPVILDTDIGDDIDDTWALVVLLKSPELDLRLVTTTHGKAVYRAKLICRILEAAGRPDVPVGLGAGGLEGTGRQRAWVEGYDLGNYPGKIHDDGAKALLDTVRDSSGPVTIISIGPSTTVAAALEKQPAIASRARFVGMQGAVRKGYNGGHVGPEYNVKENVPAARTVLLAPWRETVITPLDTCGLVRLTGERFNRLKASDDPLVRVLLENFRIWAERASVKELTASSVLFDTVAVYLALPGGKPLLAFEQLRLNVMPNGLTVIDPAGAKMSVAAAWQDLAAYEGFLVSRLLARRQGQSQSPGSTEFKTARK
jgi:inosine-uridine nucleoside N-ribohydrolase